MRTVAYELYTRGITQYFPTPTVRGTLAWDRLGTVTKGGYGDFDFVPPDRKNGIRHTGGC